MGCPVDTVKTRMFSRAQAVAAVSVGTRGGVLMMGRVLSFARSPHQTTQELLPWYLNGSLGGGEAEQVEEHLRGCAECRLELEAERLLHSAYIVSELPPDAGPRWTSCARGSSRPLPRVDPAGRRAGQPRPRA